MIEKLFLYKEDPVPTYIYKRKGFIHVLRDFFRKKVTPMRYRLDNLYICELDSLCHYPHEGCGIVVKTLWYNAGSYLDPTTGNRYVYDEDLKSYINISDNFYLIHNMGKLEEKVKGVKERYPQFLSKKQIEDINVFLNKI